MPARKGSLPFSLIFKSSSRKVALFNVKAYIIYSTTAFGPGSKRDPSACDIIESRKLYCSFIEKSLINLPLEFLDPKRIKSCVEALDTRLSANY